MASRRPNKVEMGVWKREHTMQQRRWAALAKDSASFYQARDGLHDEVQELLDEQRELDSTRQAEQSALARKLRKKKNTMLKIRSRVQALSEGRDLSVDLEGIMGAMEAELHHFKAAMRKEYNQVAEQEQLLSREVKALAARFDSDAWATMRGGGGGGREAASRGSGGEASATNAGGANRGEEADEEGKGGDGVDGQGRGADSLIEQEGLEREIERINTAIAADGGATGGWADHLHDTFLRLLSQVQRLPEDRGLRVNELVKKGATALTEVGSDEVREHYAWSVRYRGYLDKKKELVEEWRRLKRGKRQEAADRERQEQKRREPSSEQRRAVQAARLEERERKIKSVEAWRQEKSQRDEDKRRKEEVEREVRYLQEQREEKERKARAREKLAVYQLEKEREGKRQRETDAMLKRERTRVSRVDVGEMVRRDMAAARDKRKELERRAAERQGGKDQRLKEAAAALPQSRRRARGGDSRGGGGSGGGGEGGDSPDGPSEGDGGTGGRRSGGRSGSRKGYAPVAVADPLRVLAATKASRVRGVSAEELDDREMERQMEGAHESLVAGSARDLRRGQRAVPAWRKGL